MRRVIDFIVNMYDKAVELFADINDWYSEAIDNVAWKYSLSTYQMFWLGFIKGVLLVLLLQWLF
mgnify:CR=1 FL=1